MESQAIEASEVPARQVAAVLRHGAQRLLSAGIESGRLDAEVLLCHILDQSREQLLLAMNAPIDRAQWHAYEHLLARRVDREPVAYITGRREFWSLDFHVSRDVLIPRPDTERLVEISLSLASKLGDGSALGVADLGTGSGAIAIVLAKELPAAKVLAVDISATALAVARHNAAKHGVAQRIHFVQGSLLEAIGARSRFDLIVSNPPYIPSAQIAGLEPEVSRWEPRAALDGGLDGLECYRRITARACDCLVRDGALVLEIGAGLAKPIVALFESTGSWNDISVYQDYSGNDRVVAARKRASVCLRRAAGG